MEGEADKRDNPVNDALDTLPEGIRENEPFRSHEMRSAIIKYASHNSVLLN